MYQINTLKAKVAEIKESLKDIEEIIELHENQEVAKSEQRFCERMGLPPGASSYEFFQNCDVPEKIRVALTKLFVEEYPGAVKKYKQNPDDLPWELRAYNAFRWLMTMEPYQVLRFWHVGRKSKERLEAYIKKLKVA